MYYPCSENKGADQLRSYREADLRLCFRIGKNLVFSRCGSSNSTILGTCKTSSLLNSAEYETFVCLYWGLTSPSTIFQSCPDGATASCVFTSTVTVGSSCVLLKDTTWCCQWGSNPGPLDSDSQCSITTPTRSPCMKLTLLTKSVSRP